MVANISESLTHSSPVESGFQTQKWVVEKRDCEISQLTGVCMSISFPSYRQKDKHCKEFGFTM